MTIDALAGPSFGPAHAPATSAVVLLHGYGSNGNDLIGMAPFFAKALPATAFYSPDAPHPWEGGGLGGRQWFGLQGYDPEASRRDPERFAATYQAMYSGAVSAAEVLNRYLDQVIATHGIPADRLALIGFSQGTMMALHVGIRRKEKLAAILGFSGAMVGADKVAAEIASKPPICLIHGEADPIVPIAALRAASNALQAAGVPVEAHVIRNLEHGIDPKGAEIGAAFLAKHLG